MEQTAWVRYSTECSVLHLCPLLLRAYAARTMARLHRMLGNVASLRHFQRVAEEFTLLARKMVGDSSSNAAPLRQLGSSAANEDFLNYLDVEEIGEGSGTGVLTKMVHDFCVNNCEGHLILFGIVGNCSAFLAK